MQRLPDLKHLLANDHVQLDVLLARTIQAEGAAPDRAYEEFREALLQHIVLEEEVLFPELRRTLDAAGNQVVEQLRLDHRALMALITLRPRRNVVETIRSVLTAHHVAEEGPHGLHDLLDAVAEADLDTLLVRLRNVRAASVIPTDDGPAAIAAARQALEEAGLHIAVAQLES